MVLRDPGQAHLAVPAHQRRPQPLQRRARHPLRQQYGGEHVYKLNAKELGLNDIKDSVSEYFNHLIFAPILNNVYMRALSAVTHKDYMTRRYMWKLDYWG